ncbi:MAG TPA: hypothetical protein VG405_05585 [Solirubrobacteraceae bacterium]|jgi:hypothetical protein|nr:hypothetical protein [Solirubrobacteraceae bacterium]
MSAPSSEPRRRPSSRVRAVIGAAGAIALLAGCGSSGDRVPKLKQLPLVPGLHTVVSQRMCDRGRNAYCALELVMQGGAYSSSIGLQRAERLLLKRRGWKKVNAPVGQELAADSPESKLRVTYAAANMELEAVDLGWITRSRRITLTLSKEIFDHHPALAVLLQLGAT